MSQSQKQESVEPIFEKKETNKYEKKAFKPSIADVINKIKREVLPENEIVKEAVDHLVDKEDRENIAKGVGYLETTEQQTALLNEMDPRNAPAYFKAGYLKWARDNSNTHTNLASISSRVSFWIGSTFVANPASVGIPDYVWYLPKDRGTVFRGHFDPRKTRLYKDYYLETNRILLIQREKITRNCAIIFLVFGLVIGGSTWALHKVGNGISYVSNKVHAANEATKSKEEQLANLTNEANALVAKQKANEITIEEFKAQADLLREREKAIKAQ